MREIPVSTHTRTHARTHTRTHTHKYSRTHSHTYTHSQTHHAQCVASSTTRQRTSQHTKKQTHTHTHTNTTWCALCDLFHHAVEIPVSNGPTTIPIMMSVFRWCVIPLCAESWPTNADLKYTKITFHKCQWSAHMYIYTYMHTRIYTHTHIYIITYVYMLSVRAYRNTHKQSYTYNHIHMTYLCAQIRGQPPTRFETSARIHFKTQIQYLCRSLD